MNEEMPWYYEMQSLGFNFRMSDINAALGLSQLKKLDQFIAQRHRLMARYRTRYQELPPAFQPLKILNTGDAAWHLNVLLIDFDAIGKTRTEIMTRLREKGIGAQVHYIPIPNMPYYRRLRDQYSDGVGSDGLPGAQAYYAKTLSLPLHVSMNEDDVDQVIDALHGITGVSHG